jgi:hypothetical protein
MTTARRITTTTVALLSLAAVGAPAASAWSVDFVPARPQPSRVYSRPDKSMLPTSATSGGDFLAPAAPPPSSLTQQQRQRVDGISALSDRQLAAAFGTVPPIANKAGASQAVVQAQAAQSGFDWGDAGIGAAGGLALAMLGLGGGLLIYRQRPQRSRRTTAVPS